MGTETWYVMEDGSVADPQEISPDKAGVLKHKDGRAVAYAPHGPRSRSVDPDEERKTPKAKPKTGDDKAKAKEPAKSDRQMKADSAVATYKTR